MLACCVPCVNNKFVLMDELMIKAYYRVPNIDKPKLRCLAVDSDVYDGFIKDTLQTVLAQLSEEREVFLNPILISIRGGKL